MQAPGETPGQVNPNLARFNALRALHGELVKPVTIDIPGLGRSARVTCTPKGAEQVEVEYRGVSERGQALADRFAVRPGPAGGDPLCFRTADGATWRLGHAPGFLAADDEDCLVGPSEDMRIREAIPTAIAAYIDAHPGALLAAELLRQARRHAVHEAAIRTAELKLAADRRGLAAIADRVAEFESALDAALDSGPSPSP